MTEYDYSPEAWDRYIAAQDRISRLVQMYGSSTSQPTTSRESQARPLRHSGVDQSIGRTTTSAPSPAQSHRSIPAPRHHARTSSTESLGRPPLSKAHAIPTANQYIGRRASTSATLPPRSPPSLPYSQRHPRSASTESLPGRLQLSETYAPATARSYTMSNEDLPRISARFMTTTSRPPVSPAIINRGRGTDSDSHDEYPSQAAHRRSTRNPVVPSYDRPQLPYRSGSNQSIGRSSTSAPFSSRYPPSLPSLPRHGRSASTESLGRLQSSKNYPPATWSKTISNEDLPSTNARFVSSRPRPPASPAIRNHSKDTDSDSQDDSPSQAANGRKARKPGDHPQSLYRLGTDRSTDRGADAPSAPLYSRSHYPVSQHQIRTASTPFNELEIKLEQERKRREKLETELLKERKRRERLEMELREEKRRLAKVEAELKRERIQWDRIRLKVEETQRNRRGQGRQMSQNLQVKVPPFTQV
ncbi:hypothetical protein FA15DRAFT_670120 [Coprinopsis marcescibilis]|uniref:Uncharacterized protein n=1 Tax=Coprinopsis marcescibilis TaxID=230819 RepID=A0A5C3L6J8_COPMA|nr:hypothetical protein FA15DRAFT_670120 [Coprinopsis marcescibilis]